MNPGPAAYNTSVEAIGSPKGKAPRYTISGRNDRSKNQAPTPGPMDYVHHDPIGANAPKQAFTSGRHSGKAAEDRYSNVDNSEYGRR